MFYFNSEKFDFWDIYETIKRFYPIGIKKDNSEMYFSYPGIKALDDIVVENLHDQNNYIARWGNFTKEIETEIGKKIIGTTYGQGPSFSSYVLLDTAEIDNLTRTKELHFFTSLIGPFYTIIGKDVSTVTIGKSHFYSTTYLIVSPEIEFADTFKYLSDKIEKRFPGFRFVPFGICKQTIQGLEERFSSEPLNTVFHALFNNQEDLTAMWKIIGNEYHKHEDWIKDGYVDPGGTWVVYPPDYTGPFDTIKEGL